MISLGRDLRFVPTRQVSFTPAAEKIHNYNVICAVRKKPTRLTLNVKGEGYAIHQSVQLESSMGRPLELSATGVNELDFGQVGNRQMDGIVIIFATKYVCSCFRVFDLVQGSSR